MKYPLPSVSTVLICRKPVGTILLIQYLFIDISVCPCSLLRSAIDGSKLVLPFDMVCKDSEMKSKCFAGGCNSWVLKDADSQLIIAYI